MHHRTWVGLAPTARFTPDPLETAWVARNPLAKDHKETHVRQTSPSGFGRRQFLALLAASALTGQYLIEKAQEVARASS